MSADLIRQLRALLDGEGDADTRAMSNDALTARLEDRARRLRTGASASSGQGDGQGPFGRLSDEEVLSRYKAAHRRAFGDEPIPPLLQPAVGGYGRGGRVDVRTRREDEDQDPGEGSAEVGA